MTTTTTPARLITRTRGTLPLAEDSVRHNVGAGRTLPTHEPRLGVGRGLNRTSGEVAAVQELLQTQRLWTHAHQAHAVLVQEPAELTEVARDPATHHAAEAPQPGHHAGLLLPQAAQLHQLLVGCVVRDSSEVAPGPITRASGLWDPPPRPTGTRQVSPPRSPRASRHMRPRGQGPQRSWRQQLVLGPDSRILALRSLRRCAELR